jgi:hypothetical protein
MLYRGAIVAIVLLGLLRHASADTVVIVGTPGQIGAALSGAAVGRALAAGADYASTKAEANAQIATERRRFFAEVSAREGFRAGRERIRGVPVGQGSVLHVDESVDRLSG